jgi:TolB-like protein/Tfp pilus assembly protein PilF
MSGKAPESGTGPPPTDPPAAVQVPNASIHVFISYASKDSAVAAALVEALERHGVKCWIAPRDVRAGTQYADAIIRAISGAKVIVLVLSESAIASSHVSREIERASSKKRPIIALRIDAAPLTPALEYFLSESQWVEAQTGNMEAAYAKLIDDIRDPARTAPRNTPAMPLEASAATARAAHPNLRINWILLAAGTVFVVAALLVYKFWISSHVAREKPVATTSLAPAAAVPAQPTISEKSVGVMPFLDMSEKKDQEYFSDGLSEELIDMLTKIPELRVPARTSSFYFKGKQATIADIAKALSVVHLLEGSVRKSGNTLRITVQLVRADNGYHLWSQTYDRKLDDIFKIQDEIASAVVKALKVSLLGDAVPKPKGTGNVEAYTLYLQGRAVVLRAGTVSDFEKAADYLQQALKLDPKFAPAWVWLSVVRSTQAGWVIPVQQGYEEARRAASQAQALDPNLSEAHSVMGMIHLYYDWDWARTRAEVQKALELDPSNPYAWLFGGRLAQITGHYDEALESYQRAIASDPLNAFVYYYIGSSNYMMGRFAEAQAAFRKAADLDPGKGLFGGSIGPGLVKLATGEPAAALAEIERVKDDDDRGFGRAITYHALGRKADADLALAEYEKKYAEADVYRIAEIYAFRGEIDRAFAWLDRAYRQRAGGLPVVGIDPLLKNLHPDPRFTAFLRKMKLPE